MIGILRFVESTGFLGTRYSFPFVVVVVVVVNFVVIIVNVVVVLLLLWLFLLLLLLLLLFLLRSKCFRRLSQAPNRSFLALGHEWTEILLHNNPTVVIQTKVSV